MHLETEADTDLDETSTVKLQLPKRQHLQLHCLKILSGETMSGIAEEALDRYFQDEGLNEEVEIP